MQYIYDPFQHCCPDMNECLDTESNIDELPLIEYSPDIRKYTFIIRYKNEDYNLQQKLLYCPWCGKKLPEPLGDKWEEILETEYNLKKPSFLPDSQIPSEFLTDEWWKKRGL